MKKENQKQLEISLLKNIYKNLVLLNLYQTILEQKLKLKIV